MKAGAINFAILVEWMPSGARLKNQQVPFANDPKPGVIGILEFSVELQEKKSELIKK